jgi:transposase
MELVGYLVNAVVLEHRPVREVARAPGVPKTWLYELLARYKERGEAAFVAQSRRPSNLAGSAKPVGCKRQDLPFEQRLRDLAGSWP